MRFRPSPAPDPTRAGCSSAKKAFASEREAEEERAYLERKYDRHQSVYRCNECLAWHLTSR
jgi:hypothetical protein